MLAAIITRTDARPLRPTSRGPGNRPISAKTTANPVFETRLHYAGQVWFALTSYGLIGTEEENRVHRKDLQALRIEYSPSLEFPSGTRTEYLYGGGLWVGGIVGQDTLVSLPMDGVSSSFAGEFSGFDTISETSSLRGSIYYSRDAAADQEYYVRYSDTLIIGDIDELDSRPHRPLNIEISQRSYAWSDRFSRQFVIIESWIRNMGGRPINKMACGIFVDTDAYSTLKADIGYIDDVTGFQPTAPNLTFPQFRDPMNVAWVADNDGDPVGGGYSAFAPRAAAGVRILHAPPHEGFSFNWWLISATDAQNWGPTRIGSRTPTAGGGLGAPEGDRNRYASMINGEIDYGQLYAAIDKTAEGWRPPLRAGACDVADGLDARLILSVGPFCEPLFPGDSLLFTYAVACGDRLHVRPDLQFDCQNPDAYVQGLNFTDLDFAATWAGWIYDTPGYDSDGDGYRGEYRLANCDSIDFFGRGWGCDTSFYTGDMGQLPGPGLSPCRPSRGAPDRAGPAGPSCPQAGTDFTIETRPGEIILRWTGLNTETVADPLTNEYDFEGYRLYVARINSADQYALAASWDKEDYRRYVYDPEPPGKWIPEQRPSTIEELKRAYGPGFDPNDYRTPSVATCFRDTIAGSERCMYFAPVEYNRDNQYEENGHLVTNMIQRVGDSVYVEGNDTLTYGLYEAHLTNLNPALGLYVSLTAFDYGNLALQLDPLESLPGSCNLYAIPINSADVVVDSGLRVSVFPNPYKISFEGSSGERTTYFAQGYEAPEKQAGLVGNLIEQDRRIWFINLPSKATIRIYTLDGDLVRTIDHEWPRRDDAEGFLSDYSSRAAWDLVSRNTQAVVSGVYIYHIDSPQGTQTGKLVIIK